MHNFDRIWSCLAGYKAKAIFFIFIENDNYIITQLIMLITSNLKWLISLEHSRGAELTDREP